MSRRIDTDYITETEGEKSGIDNLLNLASNYAQEKFKPLARTPGRVSLTCLTVLVSVLVLKLVAIVIGVLFLPLVVLAGLGTLIFGIGAAASNKSW